MNKIPLEEKICVVTVDLMQKLFEEGADCVSLYMFLYMTVKRQKTNQVRATDSFCMKGLGWGKERLLQAKKILVERKLIEQIVRKDAKGRIQGFYIKINYIWSEKKTDEVKTNSTNVQWSQYQTVDSSTSGNQETNASSNININALSNTASGAREGPKKKKREPKPIIWLDYLLSMDNSPQEHIQLVGYYFRRRKIHFDTDLEVEEAISRHARAAMKVTKFSKDKVFKAFDEVERFSKQKGFDYTLETIYKELTK